MVSTPGGRTSRHGPREGAPMEVPTLQTWELYYPEAAATGIEVARARIDPTEVVWLHAAPPVLAVTVRRATIECSREGRRCGATGPDPDDPARVARRDHHAAGP